MLLTCPHCAKFFRVDSKLILTQGQRVRCPMCHHIWTATPISTLISIPVSTPTTDLSMAQKRLKSLWKTCFAALLVAALLSSEVIDRGLITAYAPFLINGFNAIGLTIRPALSQLQVVSAECQLYGQYDALVGRSAQYWNLAQSCCRHAGDGDTACQPGLSLGAGVRR